MMRLSAQQEKMLDGEEGLAVEKAMKLIVALGEIYHAEKLIPVISAQVSGVSYKTIGDAGVDFIEDYAAIMKEEGRKVRIKTTMNPAGMDLDKWALMGVDKAFAEKQLRIFDAYVSMGIEPSLTCTPYYFISRPKFGEHIAWAESSAVSYANSVLGARTNREGGPSALASAITGLTAEYGLHLEENRKADIIIDIGFRPDSYMYAALGNHLGALLSKMGKKVPYFRGIKPVEDEMKALGAAMAATGSIALYHVENTTPEWKNAVDDKIERITISEEEIKEHIRGMDRDCEPELIAIGCPHASEQELGRVAELVKGKKKREGKELWISVSRAVAERNPGAVSAIEEFGGLVLRDTCMVVSPIEKRFRSTGVNSGKAAYYLPKESFCGQCVRFRPLEELVMMAVEGER